MPTIKRNSQASDNVNRAHAAGIIQNLVERIGSPYKLTLRNVKGSGGYYALTGNSNEFLGFAVVSNNPNSVRHLELIATRSGYGDMLMRRVISNAKNNKRDVTLEAAANRLVNYYKKYGFQLTGQGRLMRLPLS
jgi:hypothetical protein